MKRKHLKKMILLGVSSAVFMSVQNKAFAEDAAPNSIQQNSIQQNDMVQTPDNSTMTAQELAFSAQLNDEAKHTFDSMSSQERQMAMQTASAGCKSKHA